MVDDNFVRFEALESNIVKLSRYLDSAHCNIYSLVFDTAKTMPIMRLAVIELAGEQGTSSRVQGCANLQTPPKLSPVLDSEQVYSRIVTLFWDGTLCFPLCSIGGWPFHPSAMRSLTKPLVVS